MDREPVLTGQKDKKILADYFAGKFSAANFMFCWAYMDGYIDVEASANLGLYYMKSQSHSSLFWLWK